MNKYIAGNVFDMMHEASVLEFIRQTLWQVTRDHEALVIEWERKLADTSYTLG